jgi:hypothetical protein
VAKEICTQRRQALNNNESVGKLLGLSFGCLGYPPTDTIRQIGTAIANVGQQMGIFRNEVGSTSHGKTLDQLSNRDKDISNLTGDFLINSTELVCCFLIEAFQTDNPLVVPEEELTLTDNDDFNEYWDSIYGEFIMTEDYTYSASEILFYVDQTAYKSELNAYKTNNGETDNGE